MLGQVLGGITLISFGACIGVLIMACLSVGKREDEQGDKKC